MSYVMIYHNISARQPLPGGTGGVDWALKGDGFAARMQPDAARGLSATAVGARRLRLLVEGSADWSPTGWASLRPRLEFGGRWDGGHLDEGFGQELGGGVTYANTRLGLEADARGRYLPAHRSSGFEEWGAHLAVLFDPGGDGLGAWIRVSPQWGAADGGARSLWESALPDDGGPAGWAWKRAYRFEGARAIRLTFDQDGRGGGRSWGLGGRFAPDAPRNLFIEAEASRSESEAKAPEHGIGLKLRVNW